MATRLDLQATLENLLGSKEVYYRTPQSKGMKYPAIKYKKVQPDIKRADDITYLSMQCYEIIVMTNAPDHPVIDELLKLPYCSWDRWYAADGLNHDVLTLYY